MAWAKLAAKIATKHDAKFEYYTVFEKSSGNKDPEAHRVTTIKDKSGRRWAQSNTNLLEIDDLNDVIVWMYITFKKKWPNGVTSIEKTATIDED